MMFHDFVKLYQILTSVILVLFQINMEILKPFKMYEYLSVSQVVDTTVEIHSLSYWCHICIVLTHHKTWQRRNANRALSRIMIISRHSSWNNIISDFGLKIWKLFARLTPNARTKLVTKIEKGSFWSFV